MKRSVFKGLAGLFVLGMVLTIPYAAKSEVWAEETEAAIDETNFPDESFGNYVLGNLDTDKNESLSSGEIAGISKIDIRDKTYQTLKVSNTLQN